MHNKLLTYATGLVKPKTSALFFDKLWVPEGSEQFGIELPQEFSLSNDLNSIQMIYHQDFSKRYWVAYGSSLASISHQLESLSDLIKNLSSDPQITDKETLEFGKRRNSILMQFAYTFNTVFGMNITPIFINYDVFLDSLHHCKAKEKLHYIENSIKLNTYLKEQNLNGITYDILPESQKCMRAPEHYDVSQNLDSKISNVVEVCIKNIPITIEEDLDWKQIKDIKKDKKSIKAIRRLKLWLNTDFKDKSETEIVESLNMALDEYSFALMKHGVKTLIGGFTTVVSASLPLIKDFFFDKNTFDIITTSLSASAILATYTSNEIINYLERRREPIAFLYDLYKKGGFNNMYLRHEYK